MNSQDFTVGANSPSPQKAPYTTANQGPQTLFQLLIMLAKKFATSIIWRLVISVLTFVAVFVVHTYLMVVVNDTLRVVENNKVLSMILNLIPSRPQSLPVKNLASFNMYIFWILLSNVVSGSIGRVIAFGIKQFFLDIFGMFSLLFKGLFTKIGSSSITNILLGIAIGLLAGVSVLNNAVCILLALFLLLSLSQKEKSFIILVLKLTKSDMQRLFRVKVREPLNIDGLIIIAWGLILGLLISGFIPTAIFGKGIIPVIIKIVFFIAFVLIGGLNAARKGTANLVVFFISVAGFMFLCESSVFADDSGWSESGRNMSGWLKNGGTPQALKLGLPPSILAGLASLLGPMFPGFMKDLLKNPKTNPYDYLRSHLSQDQMDKLKGLTKDNNQKEIDAINADNSYTNFWKGFFNGCGKDMSEIASATAEFTKNLVIDVPTYIYNNTGEAFTNSMKFVGQCGEIAKGIGNEIASIAKDLKDHPEILTDTFGMTAKDLLTDPAGSAAKVASSLYDMSGLKDIVECTDPSKSATERAGLYAMGVMKLWGLVDGAGMAADLSKAGASKLAGMAENLIKSAGGSGERLTAQELQRLFIAKEGKEMGEVFAKDFVDAVKGGKSEEEIMQKIMNIQQDRNSMKALNELAKTDPQAVIQYNTKLANTFEKVDKELAEELSAKLGCKSSDIEVVAASNKSGQIKVGFDRDVTIRINGRDVPPEEWSEIYKQKLYDNTKQYFPPSATPESIASKLDHTCTDKFHPEAYGSNETALDHAINKEAHLINDPEQVGQAITYKGMKHFDEASKIKLTNPIKYEDEISEGMRQITKQWGNQVTPASEYFGAAVDSKLQKAIDIMKGVNSGKPPVEIEKALKAIGYTKEQVAQDVGKTFETIVKFGRK